MRSSRRASRSRVESPDDEQSHIGSTCTPIVEPGSKSRDFVAVRWFDSQGVAGPYKGLCSTEHAHSVMADAIAGGRSVLSPRRFPRRPAADGVVRWLHPLRAGRRPRHRHLARHASHRNPRPRSLAALGTRREPNTLDHLADQPDAATPPTAGRDRRPPDRCPRARSSIHRRVALIRSVYCVRGQGGR